MRVPAIKAAAVLLWLAPGLAAAGDDDHPWHRDRSVIKPAPAPPPRTACDAGDPFFLSKHAMPVDSGCHYGYYVGGGSWYGGSGPCLHEGTYGWDYNGIGVVGAKVRLNWAGRYQSGGGRYKTEGPKPIEHLKSHFHGE